MKKNLTFILVLPLIILKGYAQCPSGGFVTLSTQAEVNNFPIQYPNCTEITDEFVVGTGPNSPPSDIVDLTPLSQLTSVGSLSYIRHNPNLTSLAGLENLATANSTFSIWANSSLTDLSALQFSYVQTLIIRDNDMLTDLSSIANIDLSGTETVYIDGNDNLSVCNTPNICKYLNMGGNANVQDNAPGCNDDIEVGESCNLTVDCPTGDVTLISQAEVDDFATLYPDCTELSAQLMIGFLGAGTDIEDLSPLNNITSVQGSLWIGFNNVLSSLSGLNIQTVGENLYVGNNPALMDLNGLDNLMSVGALAGFDASVTIKNNPLTNLSPLSNLSAINGRLQVSSHSTLTDISGLENMDPNTITDLWIYDNPNLSFCSVLSLCNYLGAGGMASELYGNGANCNEIDDILNACSFGNITGNVFSDINIDCVQGTGEPSLGNWLVKVENSEEIQYTYTTQDGSYTMYLDDDNYTVSTIPPNSLWGSTCPEINVDVAGADIAVDLGATATALCPLLEVDITAPIVRRCFDSGYYVRYCNSGTVIAESAYVEVQLDPFFTYQNSTIAGIDLGENLYSFDLGNLDVGECGSFRIDVYVDCDSTVLGQTHCVEAHIFPDSICTPALPLWDGSSIKVDAQCLGDSIEFKIENVGTGDMSDSLEYLVVEDNLIFQHANFKLNSGNNLTFYKEANGAFHRLEAEQSPGHPGSSMPSVFVEGCGTNDDGEISIGFVNYYLLDEGDAFVSIDCQESVGSYDPNDKQGFPIGHGPLHFITDSTDLEYMIRFQNTGTDTAFNIVIRDTISPHLNIETLRPGVASHPYTYDIDSSNIAVFSFNNIMLPDSNINEVASHGFVKFSIEQQPDNELRDIIENSAAIYFDFNEPVITNTVFHTVNADFVSLITSIVTPPSVTEADISVNVFPNPFDEYTTFEIEGKKSNELRLSLYDITGREVLQQHTTQQHIKLYKNNLPSGIYMFRLTNYKQLLATGKLIIK